MSMIVDSRQTYFDAEGNRLSGGRLRFYLWGTTTPATVYSDLELTTPITGTIQLTSAGWSPFEIFSSQDLDVRADRFIGLDEFGVESYAEVKSFRYIPGSSTGGGGGSGTTSMAVVESIADLRELSTSFSAAHVLGYHANGDCPARTFINVPASAAIDNSGTIIGSTADPTMRWIWAPDCSDIDCRTFGVIPSASTTVNSQLSTILNFCDASKATAFFPAGTYQLAPGSLTSNAAIHAKNGVRFNRGVSPDPNTAHWYHLTLTNPLCKFEGTFAGANLELVINGDGWRDVTLPSSVWDETARGYAKGTAVFGLLVQDGADLTFSYDHEYTCLVVHGTATVDISSGTEIAIDHIDGSGSVNWIGDAPTLRIARRSNAFSKASAIASKCTELFIVDTSLSLAASTVVNCLVQVLPPATLTLGASCILSRGVTGYPGCIAGNNGFASDAGPDMNMFAVPNACMDTWNRSTDSNALDLKSRTVTIAPAKAGKIINGVIQADTSVSLILDNVSFIGYFSGSSLKATNCSFSHTTKPIGGGTHTLLTDCQITTTAPTTIEDGTSCQWERVVVTGNVHKYGSGGYWRDVTLTGGAIFVPGANRSLGNFSWIGGSAYKITLNAGLCATEGACTLYNFRIQNLIGLSGGIQASSLNTSAKYWATSGHYNVMIGDNERGPATYGWASGTQTAGGDSLVLVSYNTTDILWLTNYHTSNDLLSFAHAWNIAEYNNGSLNTNWTGEGYFFNYPPGTPFINGSRTRGVVSDNSKCTYQFEIYKKVL